jgi:hypothetical protein
MRGTGTDMRSVIFALPYQCISVLGLLTWYLTPFYPVIFFVLKLCLQVNPDMVPAFEKAGLQFVGKDETGKRMEVKYRTRNLTFPVLRHAG